MARKNRIVPFSLLGASAFVIASAVTVAYSSIDSGAVIKDVRIGERGMQTRVALFCSRDCVPRNLGDGRFFIIGAADQFELDVSAANHRVAAVKALRSDHGSAISLDYSGELANSSVKPCVIKQKPAACIDLFFVKKDQPVTREPASTTREPASGFRQVAVEPKMPAPSLKDDALGSLLASLPTTPSTKPYGAPEQAVTIVASVPTTPSAGPLRDREIATLTPPTLREVPAPSLRERPQLAMARPTLVMPNAVTAAPERLAPEIIDDADNEATEAAPILAKVQPIESIVRVATPSLRQDTTLASNVKTTVAGRIETILGKQLSPAYCNNAEATLQADAWALGSMVDVGLCKAASGDLAEAEAILSRLLAYTPDNYEALVGRAVIAEQAGEQGAAMRYYQEALNAPPPVQESARIVEAMAALG